MQISKVETLVNCIVTYCVAKKRRVFTVRLEQLLYCQTAAERTVRGVCPTAASQVQKRLNRFPSKAVNTI